MASQSGSTVVVSISAPNTSAATVAQTGAFTKMRLTDRNGPSLEVGELTSGEVSANRQETSIRSGFQQVSGQLGFEFSYRTQDDLIALACPGAFNGGAAAATIGAADNDLTAAGALTCTDNHNVLVGEIAKFTYDTAANVIVFIGIATGAKTAQALHYFGAKPSADLEDKSLSVVVGDSTGVQKGSMLYSTIVKQYPDAGVALSQAFGGCTVNNFSMSIQPGSLVTGTVDLLGLEATAMATTYNSLSTHSDAPTSTAYSPFSSCVFIENAPNAVVSGLDFTINNNRETLPLLCSAFADDVYEGVANVTGTMTLLFENANEYNKFQNETESEITIVLDAGDTANEEWSAITFPRVRYQQPSFEVPSNGPVVLTLNFRALETTAPVAGQNAPTSCVFYRHTTA
jgi:hypothetical protein